MTTMIILIVFTQHLLFVAFELMAHSVNIDPPKNQQPEALPHQPPQVQNPVAAATQRRSPRGLMAGPA